MPKVTGMFEIKLRTPIYISFDFDVNKVADLRLEVDGNNVLVRPLELRPPVEVKDEGGNPIDIEPPALDRICIWITKDIRGPVSTMPKQLLQRNASALNLLLLKLQSDSLKP